MCRQFLLKTVAIIGITVSCSFWLSACAPNSVPTPSPTPTKTKAGKIRTENGQPTGLYLDNLRVLRFSPPHSKLYTDPLAFQTAVQSGLGAFLISVREPAWSENCLSATGTIEHDRISLCRVGEVDVYQEVVSVSDITVWLAAPASNGKADKDLAEVLKSLTVETTQE